MPSMPSIRSGSGLTPLPSSSHPQAHDEFSERIEGCCNVIWRARNKDDMRKISLQDGMGQARGYPIPPNPIPSFKIPSNLTPSIQPAQKSRGIPEKSLG